MTAAEREVTAGAAGSGAAAADAGERLPVAGIVHGGSDWIDDLRRAAWSTYRNLPMPDRALHLWRYTDPAEFKFALGEGEIELSAPGGERVAREIPEQARAAGVTAVPLIEAARKEPELVRRHLGGLIPAEFGKPEALNAALWTEGTFIHVPCGVELSEPLVLTMSLEDGDPFRAVRNLVVIEPGASATIVEESRGSGVKGRALLNEVTELFVGADSQVRFIPLQHVGREVTSHRTVRARIDRQARLVMVIASFGGGLYKADLGTRLDGPGAESRMIGLCFGDGRQRADHHTVQDHRAEHTNSDIDFRVALSGRARSAYTGLIRIAKEARYAEAYQENRNLLLSEQCRAESIPELEILTDEVRCKHGATVGPIDQDQLFYLATRGVGPAEATRIVVSGFLEAALANFPGPIADSIRDEMARRLNGI